MYHRCGLLALSASFMKVSCAFTDRSPLHLFPVRTVAQHFPCFHICPASITFRSCISFFLIFGSKMGHATSTRFSVFLVHHIRRTDISFCIVFRFRRQTLWDAPDTARRCWVTLRYLSPSLNSRKDTADSPHDQINLHPCLGRLGYFPDKIPYQSGNSSS